MNGTLHYADKKWFVRYSTLDPEDASAAWNEELPIRPESLIVFRCVTGREVKFDIVDEFTHPHLYEGVGWGDGIRYARLYHDTKPGFVEKRIAQMKSINDKSWDEIYEEYSNDQYPPFGGPFTDSLSFTEWLKLNYIAPDRINQQQ